MLPAEEGLCSTALLSWLVGLLVMYFGKKKFPDTEFSILSIFIEVVLVSLKKAIKN
jgi:hypothetical protein